MLAPPKDILPRVTELTVVLVSTVEFTEEYVSQLGLLFWREPVPLSLWNDRAAEHLSNKAYARE